MNPLEILLQQSDAVEAKLGYTFQDKKLLALAFAHRSFANEYRHISLQHNERLEFLGDSVLNLIVADYLYRKLPNQPEGDLSHLRSRLVEASSCFVYIQRLDVAGYLMMGRGERANPGRGRETILADLFEAIIGAIYLDGGMDVARQYYLDHFTKDMEALLQLPMQNWKAQLQYHIQKSYQAAPVYTVLEESGPDHDKTFLIIVSVKDEELGRGTGSSKKEAQQAAALAALEKLGFPGDGHGHED